MERTLFVTAGRCSAFVDAEGQGDDDRGASVGEVCCDRKGTESGEDVELTRMLVA